MPKSSVEQNISVVAAAATFAARKHGPSPMHPEGQKRKGTGFPYITHPIGVANILREYYPDDENLEAAGYLHDVIEDTPTGPAELTQLFGLDIADLVVAVTNDKTGTWRLEHYVHFPRVMRLKAADTLDNVLDTIRGLEKGHNVWSRFSAGERKADTWRKHVDLIRSTLGDEELVVRLNRAVTQVEGLRRVRQMQRENPHRDAALRFHLGSKHALANWIDVGDVEGIHEHEHDGPGTIRNHDRDDLTYDVAEAEEAAGDHFEMKG